MLRSVFANSKQIKFKSNGLCSTHDTQILENILFMMKRSRENASAKSGVTQKEETPQNM